MNKSKTNFIEYNNCQRKAWYSYNGHPKKEMTFVENANIVESYKVEKLATKLFPGIKKSMDFIQEINQSGPVAMYQPNITGEAKIKIHADIIVKDSDSKIHLYEVKSSTKLNKKYIPDIAIQKSAFNYINIPLETTNLIHIDKTFELKGGIEPQNFFQIEDVTNEVTKYLNKESNISNYIKEIESKNILDRNITSANCNSCPYQEPCFDGISNFILNIPRGNIGGKIQKLIDRGIDDIRDIPEDIKFTNNQQKYADIQISNKSQINKPAIKELLSDLEFPIMFFDYETVNPAIPKYDGMHPYEQTPFQYSIHLLEENGIVTNGNYLHLNKSNPMPDLLQSLSTLAPNKGSVIVWNDSFEKSINDMMAEIYPEYKILLNSLNERMFDLSIIFKNHYLHPMFMGSYSLKNVLPVFYDRLQYSDLSISEGQTASFKWLDMIFGNLDINEKEKIKKDLLAYSELDTEGMLKIYQSLVNLVN